MDLQCNIIWNEIDCGFAMSALTASIYFWLPGQNNIF